MKLTPPATKKNQFFFVSVFNIFDRSVKLPSSNFLYSRFSDKDGSWHMLTTLWAGDSSQQSWRKPVGSWCSRCIYTSSSFLVILTYAVTLFILRAFLMPKSGTFMWINVEGNSVKWIKSIRSGEAAEQCFWYQTRNEDTSFQINWVPHSWRRQ